jgi:hypothetical protein
VDVAGRQRLARVASKGLPVRYSCTTACDVSATLSLRAATARRLHVSPTLATGAARQPLGGKGVIRLELSRATIKRLQRVDRLAVTVHVTIGNASLSERYSARVSLSRR